MKLNPKPINTFKIQISCFGLYEKSMCQHIYIYMCIYCTIHFSRPVYMYNMCTFMHDNACLPVLVPTATMITVKHIEYMHMYIHVHLYCIIHYMLLSIHVHHVCAELYTHTYIQYNITYSLERQVSLAAKHTQW